MATESPYGGRLMFTQSWEDPECDRAALTIRPGDHVLAITSGGDNVLDFLRDDPAEIISIDINPAQAFLFELKRAAFLRLDYDEFLDLLGVGNNDDAPMIFRKIREDLSPAARGFFDAREKWFETGLITQGGFERYFAVLRQIIRLAVGRRTIERLFTLDGADQPEFYDNEWNGWRWRALMKIGCSKTLLGNRLDPSWFKDSDTADFGTHFLNLAKHVIADLPAKENYFLAQIMLGRYVQGALPAYLRPENFEIIRSRLDRVRLVTADIGAGLKALPAGSVDALALSNVFEYSPAELFETSKDDIIRVAKPGARIAHRNLLAPRRLGDDDRFIVDARLSGKLQKADRGFIYSYFEAARVR